MELSHLRYFLEVARNEHITKSAKNLCIAQPALTHAIHKLESDLDVPLFENKGRNIKLTEYGKYFYKQLLPLYEDIINLPKQLRAMASKDNSTIFLNILAASSGVAKAVIAYKRKNPKLNFNLIQNEESKLYDVCVRTYANYKETPEEGVSSFIFSEKIMLAVPNTAKYRQKDEISLKEIQNENFIELYGSKQFRAICNTFCKDIGFSTHIAFESDNVIVVKEAIAAGIGVGFWPEYSWGRIDRRRIRLLKITDGDFKRDIIITYRKNKQDNTEAEEFFKFLTGYLASSWKKRRHPSPA
jgi:LysR family transcriptional regulator, transcription activator of glutamate synthase operon